MIATPVVDAKLLAAVRSAPHAVALLSVPWSGPEQAARAVFLVASERLTVMPGLLPVVCALLDEEARPVRHWLATLGVPVIAGRYALGAGSVLWLNGGRVVAFECAGQVLRAENIVAKTCSLWQAAAQPGVEKG